VYTVNSDATLSFEGEASGRAWARTLRDRVAELVSDELSPPPPSVDLTAVPDDVLLDEARRRGLMGRRSP
ncbi:MAG: hypothetical protein ACRDVD_04885, partial [Acidimicrobiia bacterium]